MPDTPRRYVIDLPADVARELEIELLALGIELPDAIRQWVNIRLAVRGKRPVERM